MKRIILSAAMILTIGTIVAFANEEPASESKVQETFKKEFSGAQHVKWQKEGVYTKATFVLGGTSAVALFDSDGELLGSMRDLLYNQLPLSVITSLEKRFANPTTIEIREIINAEGTRYRITLEGNDKTYKVSVFPDGSIDDVIKQKK